MDLKNLTKTDMENPQVLVQAMNGIFAEYRDAIAGKASKDEIEKVQAQLIVKASDLQDKITKQGDFWEAKTKEIESLKETITIQGETITKLKTAFAPGRTQKSFKDAVLEQLKAGAMNDFINDKTNKGKMVIDLKDVAFTGTYGSGAAQQAYMPFNTPLAPDAEDFDVRLIVPTGTIDSEKLEYPQERSASRTNNAAFVTENGETTTSAIGFTMATANSKRYTDHIKVSRRAMRNSTWLANHINNALLAAFKAKLNTAVIADDGSPATELNGMLNNANTFAGTGLESKFANADNFSVIRAARAEMKKTYKRMANTLLIDPLDWAVMADMRTTIGGFLVPELGNANSGFNPIVGMNVHESADVTDGGYLIADIQPSTIQLLFNGAIEILASDSDDDNFTKNLITLKIEADVMLPIYNTNAFLKGTFATDLGTILAGA